jgi:hypothetical protein
MQTGKWISLAAGLLSAFAPCAAFARHSRPSQHEGTIVVGAAAVEPSPTSLGGLFDTVETADAFSVPGAVSTGPSVPSACDCAALAAKAAGAYRGVHYANDFSYLGDPCYDDWHLGERLKRMGVGECWTVDIGGEYRLRYHAEQNMRNSAAVTNSLGLTGNDDEFLLHRTRVYLNAEHGRHFRFFGEMLDAVSEFESNALPRSIEENRAEMQNLFAEVRNVDLGAGTIAARLGRQEVLLAAQRLVSPLDWANTRRTFDGVCLTWKGEAWDVDGLWLRPMRRNAAHRTRIDPPNLEQQLYGVYGTYKGLCRDKLELFWLAIDYENVAPTGIRYDTLGTRYWGSTNDWLYEFEGGVQLGENADGTDHSAGYVTAGLGRKFPCAAFEPTVWLWYDWASGDDTVGNGFHHYEPLSHKYLGFMDLFGRRNIQDINVQATAALGDKTSLLFWYHYFRLVNQNDVPYNVNMTPFAGLPAGSSASKDLGHEFDVVITRTLTPRSSVLLGYSHFFAGDFFATTPGVPYRSDADFYYVQWHVNF